MYALRFKPRAFATASICAAVPGGAWNSIRSKGGSGFGTVACAGRFLAIVGRPIVLRELSIHGPLDEGYPVPDLWSTAAPRNSC
jgi:hypothetical protein